MKKKFINGLLMAALFVGFTSSMVSCKDYDDEKITNLEGVLADNVDALKKQLDDQKADLETQINALKVLQQTCQTNCQNFQTEITAKLKDYYTKSETYNQTEIDAKDKALRDLIIELTGKEAVAKTVADLLNEGGNVMTTALDAYLASYNNRITANENDIKTLQAKVLELNNAIDQARALAQSAKDLADANALRIDGLDKLVEGLQADVKQLGEKIDAVTTTANNALAKAEANEKLIANLQTSYDNLDKKVNDVAADVKALEGTVGNLDKKVDEKVTELKSLIDKNGEKIASVEETVKKNKDEADKLHKEISDRLAKAETDLTEFKTQVAQSFTTVVNTLNQVIYLLLDVVDYVDNQITSIEINGTYNPMYGEMALPFNVRSNMLVVFYGKTSDRGLQFPSLQSYRAALPDQWSYGNFTEKDLEMLGATSTSRLNGFVRLGGNVDFVAGQNAAGEVAEGNAGTIYLTVNPTIRDFEGTQFTLINSANEAVPATLSTLKASNHVLTFGATRAGVNDGEEGELQSPNGFYETQVTVDAANTEKIGMRYDLESIKALAKDIANYKDGISISKIMNVVYQNTTDLLDATAVKADWQAADTTFSTVSQYALGVTSVKPLSFGFGSVLDLEQYSIMGRVEDFLDNILGSVFEALPELEFLNRFEIEKLELNELTDELEASIRLYLGSLYIESIGPKSVTLVVPEFTLTGTDGKKVTIKNTRPTVTVEMDGNNSYIDISIYLGDIIRYMGKYDSEPVENIKAQLNDFLDDVTKFVQEITDINFGNIQNSLKSTIATYIGKINDRFARFLNPTKYLQPILVVKTDKGIARLSTSEFYPATANGTNVTLIPTSYNAETIAPAFKKFVAVTDVKKGNDSAQKGNAACKAALDAANAADGLNEVIEGGYSEINFNAQSGYTYTIIYSAVDYSGLIVTKKFYVTVK